MAIRVRCPACGTLTVSSEAMVGQAVKCLQCGQRFPLTDPEAEPAAPPTAGSPVTIPPLVVVTPKKAAYDPADGEPALWRNPAVWISLVAVLAVVVVFLVVVYNEPAPYVAQRPTPPPVAPAPVATTLPALAPVATTSPVPRPVMTAPPVATPAPPPAIAQVTPPAIITPPPSVAPTTLPVAPPVAPPVAASSSPSGASSIELSAEALFARASPAVVRIAILDRNRNAIGTGSGFFVKSDGTLVTNYHVAKRAAFATVHLPNGTALEVNGMLAGDEGMDLAVLKTTGTGVPALDLAPRGVVPTVGSNVFAIGYPLGLSQLSKGIVSGVPRQNGQVVAIQTDASISSGSSGGPLLDAWCRVIGVTTLALTAGGDGVAQNLNMAVPSGCIHDILQQAASAQPTALPGGGVSPFQPTRPTSPRTTRPTTPPRSRSR